MNVPQEPDPVLLMGLRLACWCSCKGRPLQPLLDCKINLPVFPPMAGWHHWKRWDSEFLGSFPCLSIGPRLHSRGIHLEAARWNCWFPLWKISSTETSDNLTNWNSDCEHRKVSKGVWNESTLKDMRYERSKENINEHFVLSFWQLGKCWNRKYWCYR